MECSASSTTSFPTTPRWAATYNAWEKRRDPSHVEALSVEQWAEFCVAAELTIAHAETMGKQMNFLAWLDNMSVPDELRPRLLDDLINADDDVRAFLRPSGDSVENAEFVLTEGILLASQPVETL